MSKDIPFVINPAWRFVMIELGINPNEVLKRAELPLDLFQRKNPTLTTDEYFRKWEALSFISQNPLLPIHLVQGISSEVFDPPIFAAYCSPNLNTALKRLSQFKALIGPMKLTVNEGPDATKMEIQFSDERFELPQSLVATELAFFVQLARMATRENIVPLRITAPFDLAGAPEYAADYEAFFGIKPDIGKSVSITFSQEDATMPFLSENPHMWDFFEPELRKRLSEVNTESGMKERAKAALLEMLPSGQCSVDELAAKLLVSRRTLQRKLNAEDTNFSDLLTQVREELARHYVTKSDLPYSQISFLLGYEDPNSFFRAFHTWTGATPDSLRSSTAH